MPAGRWRHGLVIGKFCPPHAGHHHLVDVAAALRRRGGVWSSTGWVPEYGRTYTEGKPAVAAALAAAVGDVPPEMDRLTWTPEDFVAIAERQARLDALRDGEHLGVSRHRSDPW